MWKFKYLGGVLDESGRDEAECGRRNVGTIRSLVNAMVLQLECSRVLHDPLLVSVLMHGSKTVKWKEKEKYGIRALQMDNFKGLLGSRK